MRIETIVIDGPVKTAEVASLLELLREGGVSVGKVECLKRAQRSASTAEVVRAVSAETGFSVVQLRSARRDRPIAKVRFAAAWVARRVAGASTTAIGRNLGGRDHTTIMHALVRADELRRTDADFRRLTDRVLRQFTRRVQ